MSLYSKQTSMISKGRNPCNTPRLKKIFLWDLFSNELCLKIVWQTNSLTTFRCYCCRCCFRGWNLWRDNIRFGFVFIWDRYMCSSFNVSYFLTVNWNCRPVGRGSRILWKPPKVTHEPITKIRTVIVLVY